MINLFEIYKQILKENADTSQIEEKFLLHVNQVWEQWKTKYPEEPGIADPEYMFSEIERSSLEYDLSWISMIQSMKSSNSIEKNLKPCSKILHACYYNSLDYVKKYESENINLAWGIAVDLQSLLSNLDKAINPSNTKNYVSWFNSTCTLHAFLVTKEGKVIDPTWGTKNEGYTYYYEIVPKEVWKRFTFKEADKNFDARDFADEYIANKAGRKYHISIIQDKWLKFSRQ